MDDLWPDDIASTESIKSPAYILKEQASLLGKKTKNIITAAINTIANRQPIIQYDFIIIAPALSNYRYRLFSIYYNIISIYPCTMFIDVDIFKEISMYCNVKKSDQSSITIHSESELEQAMRYIFKSEKTKQLIKSLIAESGAGSYSPE